jgi:hypothetical protein
MRGENWSEGRLNSRTSERNWNLCPQCKGRKVLALIWANLGTAQCYIPEPSHLHSCQCESIRSHLISVMYFFIHVTWVWATNLGTNKLCACACVQLSSGTDTNAIYYWDIPSFYMVVWEKYFFNLPAQSVLHYVSCLHHILLWTAGTLHKGDNSCFVLPFYYQSELHEFCLHSLQYEGPCFHLGDVLTRSLNSELSKQCWKFVNFKCIASQWQHLLCASISQTVFNYMN